MILSLRRIQLILINFRTKGCDFYGGKTGTSINLEIGAKYSSPRYFIIACKDPAKKNDNRQNFGKLENGNIRDIKVTLGLQEYPNVQHTS